MTPLPSELWPIVWRLATSGDWPPASDAGAPAFFEFANRQNLLPLLMEADDLPPALATAKPRFQALNSLHRKRHELGREGALEFLRVAGADAFLFFKGSDYRYRLYDRPELRPMNDLDVYVPPAEVQSTVDRLAAAGYRRKYCELGAPLAPGHYEISLEVSDVHVEIHRAFVQPVRAAVDYEGIWRRREEFEADGIRGHRLSPADAVLVHALSLSVDEFSPELNRYVDFFLLLQRFEDELPECVARAQAWGIERPLFGALHLTSSLFPSGRTRAIEHAAGSLLDARTRQFLAKRVLPDPATEPSGHSTGRRVQLWRKYWLMDRAWRRVAFAGYFAWETLAGRGAEWRMRRNGLLPGPRPGAGAPENG